MATWGVLRLDAGGAAGREPGISDELAARLDGVVTVTADATPHAVLAAVPSSAARIVELDEEILDDPDVVVRVERLLAEHDAGVDGHVAVVAAQPLADALKRVEREGERDVLVHGLERDGLMMPRRPHVIDRQALASTLQTTTATDGADAVSVLLATGGAVRVVPTDGAPMTVRDATRVGGAAR